MCMPMTSSPASSARASPLSSAAWRSRIANSSFGLVSSERSAETHQKAPHGRNSAGMAAPSRAIGDSRRSCARLSRRSGARRPTPLSHDGPIGSKKQPRSSGRRRHLAADIIPWASGVCIAMLRRIAAVHGFITDEIIDEKPERCMSFWTLVPRAQLDVSARRRRRLRSERSRARAMAEAIVDCAPACFAAAAPPLALWAGAPQASISCSVGKSWRLCNTKSGSRQPKGMTSALGFKAPETRATVICWL
mmetsp:Transcript_25802/g.78406  ORF Transcript_25802/g.78406 Transcript_25802/m.78406 type:complete len:249 (+) Transcript_25802:867-1613(+)